MNFQNETHDNQGDTEKSATNARSQNMWPVIAFACFALIMIGLLCFFGITRYVSIVDENAKREIENQTELLLAQNTAKNAMEEAQKASDEAEKAKAKAKKYAQRAKKAENNVVTDDEGGTSSANAGWGSYEGDTLWFIIYSSSNSKAAAERYVRNVVQPVYGDEGSPDIDKSSHYKGMSGGYWIVFSAYRSKSDAQYELNWAKSALKMKPYIKQATKLCDDYIGVCEQ